MGHYAKVVKGVVTNVIVADQQYMNNFVDTSPGKWIETSYHTRKGVHIEGGTPLRKNFAGIGYTYDIARDAFIPPKDYDSWVLDEDTCTWEPPTPHPNDGNSYVWNESTQSWEQVDY